MKSVTGFSLYGDAWQWWGAAANVYERGFAPAPGAVMVFGRTGRMRVGHVAVVRRVLGPREILIDHANWHHGRIDRSVSIRDLSPDNDWSSVEVEWTKGTYGGPFPITGFVYAPGTPLPGDAGDLTPTPEPRLVEAANEIPHGTVVMAGGRTMLQHHVAVQSAIHQAGARVTIHRGTAVHAASSPIRPAVLQSKPAAVAHRPAAVRPAVFHPAASHPAAAKTSARPAARKPASKP